MSERICSRKIATIAKRAAVSLACASCVALSAQQPASIPTAPTITVTSREVQIPVEAFYPRSEYVEQVLDLKPSDFHVEVGGETQSITRVQPGRALDWEVHDGYGYHREMSASFGIWSDEDSNFLSSPTTRTYNLAFTPSSAALNACYPVHITVGRPGTKIEYPKAYCGNTSPANPLAGSKVGLRLLAKLNSVEKGYAVVNASTGIFLSPTLAPTAQIALQFPASDFQLNDHISRSSAPIISRSSAPIALLGRFAAGPGQQSVSFSDLPLNSDYWTPDPVLIPPSYYPDYSDDSDPPRPNDDWPTESIVRYTRQFTLPAGDYSLKLVLANGGNFGRIAMPIHVPAFDPAALWTSSVFLCRRFHKPTQDEYDLMPPQYTPLLSQGMEFEPAGDSRFAKYERLTLWFQIYAPPRAAPIDGSIRYRVQLVDAKSGAIVSSTGSSDLSVFAETGNPVISVWKEVSIGKLRPGPYLVKVRATDSATGKTVQRSSSFTMVKRRN